jgi:carbon-monoxide dehydrogenase medium subunit
LKAPPFAYVKAESIEQLFDLLLQYGDRARILAGGQSLLAALNLRLSAPELLIDIAALPGMADIALQGETVRIGALVTHAELERSPVIARHVPLLAQAVPHVAHVAIRNVGTFGGSIALADPAAEYPACAIALGATFTLASKKGERRVAAREFFKGLYETALQPGEVLIGGEFPAQSEGERTVFLELARRHGDYAIIGVAARARMDAARFADARLAFFGVGEKAVLAARAGAAVEGRVAGPEAIAAAQAALATELHPVADLHTSASAKLHLAKVLTSRALAALAS